MMPFGDVLAWLSLLTGLVALGAQAAFLARADERMRRLARWATAASFALVAGSLLVLLHAFLAARLEIEYVFLYTKSTYTWPYRLAGLWAAQKGTILLWSAVIAACLALFAWRAPRPRKGEDAAELARAHAWTVLFLLAIHLAFLGLVVRQDTFAPTMDFLLSSKPEGNGLNPILKAPLSLLHPPAEFLGYGLTAVPAAAALAYLATGTRAWSSVCRTWSRVAWGFYTLGLGIGAIWAYYTLSFGGYWAWDPVEVANLIPWIAFTAFLHARVHHERHGTFRGVAPLLAFAVFWFSLFATLATRSGLWVSVHAFTDPTGTFARDPMLRLVNILHVEPQIAAIVGLMGASLLLAVALAARRFAARWPALVYALGVPSLGLAGVFALAPTTAVGGLWEVLGLATGGRTALGAAAFFGLLVALPAAPLALDAMRGRALLPSRSLLSYPTLVAGAVLLLGMAFLATLVIDARGVNGVDRAVFDNIAPFFVLPMVLLLIPLFGVGFLQPRAMGALLAGTLASSLAAAAAFPTEWVIAVAMPPLAVALALGLARLVRSAAPASASREALATLALLLFASILGVVFWAAPPARVGFAGLAFAPDTLAQVAGSLVAAAGLALAVAYARGGGRALGAAAALAGALGVGYGLGLVAALGALALVLARAPPPAPLDARAALRAAHGVARPFAIHLLHVALVIGLLGYAWSTYAAVEPEDAFVLGVGESAPLGPYTLTYVGTDHVYDGALGGLSTVTGQVRVTRDGRDVGEAHVHMKWVQDVVHYDPDTRVLGLGASDVYVSSLAMCFDPTGACAKDEDWVEAHEPGIPPLPERPTTAMAFTAKVLPLMSPVWGSLYLFVLGVVVLLAASWEPPGPRPRRARACAPVVSMDELEARLARELAERAARGR